MAKKYDLAIVGAGPAGLMAAKTAAEHGLKTVLIEKRKDVSHITRACCQLFIMDENYAGESIKLAPGKVIFPHNGFEVEYGGPTFNIIDKYYISPQGHKIHFSYEDKRPIVIKFDKGLLLKTIWEKCEKLGVEFKSSTVAYDARDTRAGIELNVVSRGNQSTVKAEKLIVADGINSRVAEALGMNKERMFFTTGLVILYQIEGIKDFERTAFKMHMGLSYQSRAPVIMCPSLEDEKVANIIIVGSRQQPPDQVFQLVRTKGALSPIFEQAKVLRKTGCAAKTFNSMKVPYQGNSLAIGDAAAYVEVETQGALMCGYRAGNAIFEEMTGKSGFEQYTKWWQNSFEFNSEEALRVAQGYALVPTYSDDELDYLFALAEDQVLPGTFSQYRSPKLMWESMLRHREKIAKERPELFNKIARLDKISLKDSIGT